MSYHKTESIAPKRRLEREAVDLAMESRWEDAAKKNRAILDSFPTDVDAYNRLGRALMEMGAYAEAKEAYNKAVELDPHNGIARKNLSRLSALGEGAAGGGGGRVAPQIFVGEIGKVGVVKLQNLAPRQALARLATGDEVILNIKGQKLIAETPGGDYLGDVEPAHGPRLVKLMQGGNRYTAAIAGIGEDKVKVVIKEVYQDPSQEGRPSFLTREPKGFRAHLREGLLRPERTEEAKEGERDTEWEEEEEPAEALPQGFSFVGGAIPDEEE